MTGVMARRPKAVEVTEMAKAGGTYQSMVPFRRRPRHWRERFDPKAVFVWSKDTTWKGVVMKAGEAVTIPIGQHKLLMLWRANLIQRADLSRDGRVYA